MANAEKLKKDIDLLSSESLNEVNNFVTLLMSRKKKISLEEKKI